MATKKKAVMTAAERKAAERARNADAGLVRREYWVHPEDFERVSAYVARLTKARSK